MAEGNIKVVVIADQLRETVELLVETVEKLSDTTEKLLELWEKTNDSTN